jgi:glycosyltransferase involved in cell wall biosynthesis
MKIVNWQKVVSFHQYYTWDSLENINGEKILNIVEGFDSKIRRSQGWTFPDLHDKYVIKLSLINWFFDGIFLLKNNKNSIHVFPGFLTEKKYFLFILFSAIFKIKFVILFEPYSTYPVGYLQDEPKFISKLKIFLRPIIYNFISILINKLIRSKDYCILSISTKGREQLLQAGFPKTKIFPFGYFIPKDFENDSIVHGNNNSLRIVFIGSLIERKGIDVVLPVMKTIHHTCPNITLDCYGSGDITKYIKFFPDNVKYKGMFPYGQAQKIISSYDLLILPSKHDGWGTVVNEALLQGIPVIISDQVGAGDLIINSKAGLIFESSNTDQLSSLLIDLYNHPEKMQIMKISAKQKGQNITPYKASKYLYDIFQYIFYKVGEKPEIFW